MITRTEIEQLAAYEHAEAPVGLPHDQSRAGGELVQPSGKLAGRAKLVGKDKVPGGQVGARDEHQRRQAWLRP